MTECRTFAAVMEKNMQFILTGLLCMMPVLSQAYEVNDSSRVIDLDEVIVISQPKESFLLRQQPVSSNVFGADEMHQLNVNDLSQLSQYVPSFVMPTYGSRLTSSLYIRGIGSRINNPAVGVYYDNIPRCQRLPIITISICSTEWMCCVVLRGRSTDRILREDWCVSIPRTR